MLRGQNQILSCCLSVLVSPPKPLSKFNQIWCVGYSHEWGVQRQTFLAPPPWAMGRGQNVIYHFISITNSIFMSNFVCVLINEIYKTYQTGILFCCLGDAPGVGLRATGVAQGVKTIFCQTWSCGISNRRGWRAEQNASNIFILGSTGDLGAMSKGQISLKYVNFKDFYTKLCVCSHK